MAARDHNPSLSALTGILIGMVIGAVAAAAAALMFINAYAQLPQDALPLTLAFFPTQTPTLAPTATAPAAPTFTPTETAVPTATADATATAAATLTPEPSATYTPEPTLTPTETPTPEPTATFTAAPTATDPPPEIPDSAAIAGSIWGEAQSLPLSCESRSAVDWAGYFGVYIKEMTFQNALPYSDNPNTGFVGSPSDERGRLPPFSYGVHADPVAALLREYGLAARSGTGLTFDDIRREIASGQPVIAWVVGNVWSKYQTHTYFASDGQAVTVVPYEHTVIVTGYTPDSVTVADGAMVYTVTLERFLTSWAALDNMLVWME